MRKRRVRADYYSFLLAHGVQLRRERRKYYYLLSPPGPPTGKQAQSTAKAREEARVDLFWRLVVAARLTAWPEEDDLEEQQRE